MSKLHDFMCMAKHGLMESYCFSACSSITLCFICCLDLYCISSFFMWMRKYLVSSSGTFSFLYKEGKEISFQCCSYSTVNVLICSHNYVDVSGKKKSHLLSVLHRLHELIVFSA